MVQNKINNKKVNQNVSPIASILGGGTTATPPAKSVTPLDIHTQYTDEVTKPADTYNTNLDTQQKAFDESVRAYEEELAQAKENKAQSNQMGTISDISTALNQGITGLATGFADTSTAQNMYGQTLKDNASKREALEKALQEKLKSRNVLEDRDAKRRQELLNTMKIQQGLATDKYNAGIKGFELKETYGPIDDFTKRTLEQFAKDAGVKIDPTELSQLNNKEAYKAIEWFKAKIDSNAKNQANNEKYASEETKQYYRSKGYPIPDAKLTNNELNAMVATALKEADDKRIALDKGDMKAENAKKYIKSLPEIEGPMKDAIKAKDGAENALSILKQENTWATGSALPTMLAKASGQVGVLTDRDVKIWEGNPALAERLSREGLKAFEGVRFTEEDLRTLKVFLESIIKSKKEHIASLRKNVDSVIKSNGYDTKYGIIPEQISSYFQEEPVQKFEGGYSFQTTPPAVQTTPTAVPPTATPSPVAAPSPVATPSPVAAPSPNPNSNNTVTGYPRYKKQSYTNTTK